MKQRVVSTLGKFSILVIMIASSGCLSNKKLIYLQSKPLEGEVSTSGKLIPHEIDEYRLQYNDVVDITMKTTSPELNEILSVSTTENQIRNLGGLNSGDAFFLNGYTIDDQGMVDLPLLGQLKLVGLTINQAKQEIESKITQFITKDNYYVRVRLGGVRYSALGEFVKPGKYTILQNRVTIFDAIANAGDMTTVAKRSQVLLIRQYPEGTRTHKINLLNEKIMESEFFFIRPNDIIYAEPMKVKQLGTGMTLAQSLQLALSVATVAFLIINTND